MYIDNKWPNFTGIPKSVPSLIYPKTEMLQKPNRIIPLDFN